MTNNQTNTLSRRAVLTGTAAALAAVSIRNQAQAASADYLTGIGPAYQFEVQRSEAEWRAQLSDDVYKILRDGETEFPTTSPYWNTNTPGIYHCQGCGLPLYSSAYYSPQEIGFVFFNHSEPDAVLTGIHSTDYNGAYKEPRLLMEAHCRRCGGHLGHILLINGEVLHCINGTALDLQATAA